MEYKTDLKEVKFEFGPTSIKIKRIDGEDVDLLAIEINALDDGNKTVSIPLYKLEAIFVLNSFLDFVKLSFGK